VREVVAGIRQIPSSRQHNRDAFEHESIESGPDLEALAVALVTVHWPQSMPAGKQIGLELRLDVLPTPA